jgi:serine/threonine protein kinase
VDGSAKRPDVPESERTRSLVATYSGEATAGVPDALGQVIEQRYQVRRMLGRGRMGPVYLARDVVLGRSVALKLVGAPIHTERFLHEARTIATLNHPNIVQLFDSGEHSNGVYLALEYVEGETLRDRIQHRRLGIDDALRHCYSIADALCHAHAAGVLHSDLKPSNVMVGRDGRLRVVDFGIAQFGSAAAETISGTSDWMAPEQYRAAPLSDRVDIWALAIVCAQLLTGLHPLGDDPEHRQDALRELNSAPVRIDHPYVPAAIADLIVRSLVFEPTLRPSASEWRHVLDNLVNGRGDTLTETVPYPGLAAFDEQHSRFYFGREREIDAFLERLRDAPHLAIVAPPGAGKSSFLRAGVIPRMSASEHWTIIVFRPGSDPVSELARHVIEAMAGDRDATRDTTTAVKVQMLRAELLETPTLLAVHLATLAAMRERRILIAVDQLEEAFTHGASEIECSQFLCMLLTAADDPQDPVRVVFTIRDDFFSKVVGLRSLFAIQKLDVDDLRRTIIGPLARCGYDFDDRRIVDDLVAEADSTEVAALPLLQFACRTLWDMRDIEKRQLHRTAYMEMGGLVGALAHHAESALAAQSPEERRTTRQLLLLLVSGTTCRSVARQELTAMTGRDADKILDRLLSARLLVQHNKGDGSGATIEIAHESLLQTWPQLARWIDESRDERLLIEELEDATSQWERRGRRDEDTWLDTRSEVARRRTTQLELVPNPRVRAFLAAGDQLHRSRVRKRKFRYGMAFTISLGVIFSILHNWTNPNPVFSAGFRVAIIMAIIGLILVWVLVTSRYGLTKLMFASIESLRRFVGARFQPADVIRSAGIAMDIGATRRRAFVQVADGDDSNAIHGDWDAIARDIGLATRSVVLNNE